jgi:hypothetical protein
METNKIKWNKKMAERCLMRWNIDTEQPSEMRNDSEEQQWEEFKKKLDSILGK